MFTRPDRVAGAARSRFGADRSRMDADFLALEPRLVFDASYQYLPDIARMPADRLAGLANGQVVILDDLNGDGVRDIAASGTRPVPGAAADNQVLGFVGIYSGSDGSLIRELNEVAYPSYGHQYSPFGQRIALIGDTNADGVRELAVSDFENGDNVNNTGAVRIYNLRTGAQVSVIISAAYPYYGNQNFLYSPGDMDNDGQPDILVAGRIGFTNLNARLLSARTGTVIWEATIGEPNEQASRIYSGFAVVGDVDSDGVPDFLFGGDDGVVSLGNMIRGDLNLVSGKTGSVIREWLPASGETGFGSQIAFLGDTNTDGTGEFAFITYRHESSNPNSRLIAKLNVQELTNTGITLPTWSLDLGTWAAGAALPTYAPVNVGDVNLDGKPDLAVTINPTSRSSSIRIVSGVDGGVTLHDIASTSVRPSQLTTTGVINFGTGIAAGDVNNDGVPEVFVGAAIAESPLEGQPKPAPFLVAIPTIKFQPYTISSISPAGVVMGLIKDKQFVTVNGVITMVSALKGVQAGDKLFDFNTLGFGVGSANVDGSDAFYLDNGVRVPISSLPTRDQYAVAGGFVTKPDGAYSTPIAFRVAGNAKLALVKRMRDGSTPTTWVVKINASNSGFELVYLFDGDPVGISPSGQTAAANRPTDSGAFIADTLKGQAQLYSTDDFRVAVVGESSIAGYSADGKSAKAGFLSPPNGGFGPSVGVFTIYSDTSAIDAAFKILGVTSPTSAQVLTYEPAKQVSQQTRVWTHQGEGNWTSTLINATNIASLPSPVDTYQQVPYAMAASGAILTSFAPIIVSPQYSPARLLFDTTPGPFYFDSSRPIASSPVDASGVAMAGFNAFGQVIYIRRAEESAAWEIEELAVPEGAVVYDIGLWSNGAALATSAGLIKMIRSANGSWDAVNLTTTLSGASGIGRSLRVMTSLDRYIILAGVNAANQVVIYGSNAPEPDKNTAWSFDNISATVLGTFGLPDPNLQGEIITYVTPWNGLNIAGINAATQPVSFWTAPGISGWRFTNLADAQEDPALAVGFSRLAVNVTPWGGVSLTNADTALRTVWWAPALGGLWKFASLSEVVTSAPKPQLVASSVVGFATTWGGQNIAGVDSSGHLWVYWWSPESNKWTATSLQSAVTGLGDRVFTPRVVAYATGGQYPMGVSAVDNQAHGMHLYFRIDSGWLWSDLTKAVDTTI